MFLIGVVNVEGLKEYLTLHNLPMMVSLSEDATAAVGKDSTTVRLTRFMDLASRCSLMVSLTGKIP